jgi:hypothetical protein
MDAKEGKIREDKQNSEEAAESWKRVRAVE